MKELNKGDIVRVIENDYEFVGFYCDGRQMHIKDQEGEYLYSGGNTLFKMC